MAQKFYIAIMMLEKKMKVLMYYHNYFLKLIAHIVLFRKQAIYVKYCIYTLEKSYNNFPQILKCIPFILLLF